MLLEAKKISNSNNRCWHCGDRSLIKITVNSTSYIELCDACSKQLLAGLSSVIEPEPPYPGKWFEIWEDYKRSILSTMHKNLSADLDAGYSYTGQSIQGQLASIDEYKHEFDEQLLSFVGKTNKEIEDWCYWDLTKSGAI